MDSYFCMDCGAFGATQQELDTHCVCRRTLNYKERLRHWLRAKPYRLLLCCTVNTGILTLLMMVMPYPRLFYLFTVVEGFALMVFLTYWIER